MSEPAEETPAPVPQGDGSGVLGNLPRARPQRASARRAAARERDAAKAARPRKTSAPKAKAKPAAKAAPKPRAAARTRRPAGAGQEPVPRQGYAGDGDRATGPVAPPGRPEMIATAAEALNELAKAGVSRGERLVRELITRLPRS